MTDVIEQARKVARLYSDVSAAYIALMAVVEAADAGHLIDARRLDTLADKRVAIIPDGRSKMHRWEVWHGEIVATASTFADALAVAEREAE